MNRIASAATTALAVLATLAASAALAQTWPNRPVRVIVPFPPGGSADLVARSVSQKFTENTGQPMVVDNRPGVDTILGMEMTAKAAPDGYTVGYSIGSALTINPFLYSKLPYDPARDYAPVMIIASVPLSLVVHPSVPANTPQELAAYIRANDGKLFYGSGNIISQIAMETVQRAVGARMTAVPYKGSAPNIQDMLRGEMKLTIEPLAGIIPHARSGKLRIIAVTESRRASAVPDVPTLAESGFPGFEFANWHGIIVPAATPRDVIGRLHEELVKAARHPDVIARVAPLAADIVASRPEEMQARINAERERFGKVIPDMKIKLD